MLTLGRRKQCTRIGMCNKLGRARLPAPWAWRRMSQNMECLQLWGMEIGVKVPRLSYSGVDQSLSSQCRLRFFLRSCRHLQALSFVPSWRLTLIKSYLLAKDMDKTLFADGAY
jgi:hypothetical protein